MRRKFNIGFLFIFFIFFLSLLLNSALGEELKININPDLKVKRFLESHQDRWEHWNVPEVGGCFTAHNVSWEADSGIQEFLDYVQRLPDFETRIDKSSQQGISISYKK